MTVRMVLPPDGEQYGFPLPCPLFRNRNEMRKWFLLHNYPKHLIEDGQLDYIKYFDEDQLEFDFKEE